MEEERLSNISARRAVLCWWGTANLLRRQGTRDPTESDVSHLHIHYKQNGAIMTTTPKSEFVWRELTSYPTRLYNTSPLPR